ncbi:MAG: GNAT family N-acetyltransferase [Crocinitomicaceae bacterium]|tara:strand:- start:154 stop:603 length:450 start_codon:yes stop_codon:yes gene_type:complete
MIQIREAKPGDQKEIYLLIKELAHYEEEPEEVINSEVELYNHLFEEKICHALVAEKNNEIIGFALYYMSYSTWKGKCLYLEDLYVKENIRKQGVGSQLYNAVIEVAKSNKVRRMDWQVLDWNQPAIDFYVKHNAQLDNHWINGRLTFEY